MSVASAAARVTERVPGYGGAFWDITPLQDFLAGEHGWSDADLARNQVGMRTPLRGEDAAALARFWRTIAEAARRLDAAGILPITIKSLRTYAFWDSNADLLIPPGSRPAVLAALYAGAWVPPSRASRVEQALVERAKIKLPSRDPELLSAHLYEGVSWRYQADIGLLPGDREAAASRLVRVDPALFGAGDDASAPAVWVPDDATELVLQAAHAVFENFRLSVGEALHFHLLRRVPGAWERAQEIAAEHGCTAALREVAALCEAALEGRLGWAPAAWPAQMPLRVLGRCYADRLRYLGGRRRLGSAAVEIGGFAAVYPLITAVRRRRLRRRLRAEAAA
ncbi:MAG TPA: hypothetical protein VFQ45_01140 [Longimicrobium sp.]|nr:hypothetical protein [Longimicrobium sp.]